MKKIIISLLTLLLFIPSVSASSKDYVTMNLKETLENENIEADLSKYEETDDQVIIYMFRGQGCSHCRDFLNFLSENVEEYGKYFKLVSYETWNNSDNAKLMKKAGKKVGTEAKGVPFIVIGNKAFSGFSEARNGADVLKSITDLYESKDRYDVIEELNKEPEGLSDGVVIAIIFGILILGFGGLILYSRKSN